MVRLRRKLLADTLLLGVALTLAVLVVDPFGLLESLGNWADDKPAAAGPFFMPAPTDKLVHLDIDDRALDVLGAWPWPRAKFAQALDEIKMAGAKVVGMDVLFAEPQPPSYEPVDPNRPQGPKREVKNDVELAA